MLDDPRAAVPVFLDVALDEVVDAFDLLFRNGNQAFALSVVEKELSLNLTALQFMNVVGFTVAFPG